VAAGISARLLEAAASDSEKLFSTHATSAAGLTQEEAEQRLEKHGQNAIAQEEGHSWRDLLLMAILNPLVILLSLLAILSAATGDLRAAIVMLLMVVLGVALRFVQEARADTAAAKLKAMIRVTATVVRDGKAREIPLAELVPGDIVKLAAGRHDTRRCAAPVVQGSVHHPGQLDRRVHAGGESSTPGMPPPAVRPSNSRTFAFSAPASRAEPRPPSWSGTGTSTYLGSIAKAIVGQRFAPASTRASAASPG
jgi:Mg2+-importing ATPase